MTTEVKEIREGYKMTELGVIPTEWEIKCISEIAKVKTGGTPSKSKPEYWFNGIIPWMSSGEINNKRIFNLKEKITELGFKNSNTTLLPVNTIMIAMNGQGKTRGTVAILCVETTCNQSLAGILPSTNFNSEYLYYYLESQYEKLRSITGEGRSGLNLRLINSFQVVLPSMNEQQKIAEILTTVDEQIESIAQLIEKTMELKNGLLQQLLTTGIGHTQFKKTALGEIPVAWEVTNFFEHIINILDFRGKTPKKIGMDWGNGDIPALSANNVKMGYIDFSAECYLGSEELYKKWMTKGDLRQGDVLFTMEAPLGNVAQVPDNNKYILSQRVVAFKTDDQLNDCYLKYFLMSPHFQMGLEKNSTGTTAKGISQKNLSKLKMIIPPLDEQQKIAEILSAVDDQIQSYQQEKAKYEELKRGLIQQLLTGKIRVTV